MHRYQRVVARAVKRCRRSVLSSRAAKISIVLVLPALLLYRAALNVSPPPSKGVAVCIAGNARTFHYKFTHETLKREVIDRLRERYETEVIFILRTDDQPTSGRPAALENRSATLTAVNSFIPTVVKWITDENELQMNEPRYVPNGLTMYERIRPPDHCGPKYHPMRFPHTLFRSRQCATEIIAREKLRGATFQWVYRLRPDVILPDGIPMPHDLESHVVYTNQGRPSVTEPTGYRWRLSHRFSTPVADGPVADTISFGGRRVILDALSAYTVVEQCDVFQGEITNGPENMLRYWLLERGVKWSAIPFDWIIIREYSGPECERLEYQNGTGSDPIASMRRCVEFAKRFGHYFPGLNVNETEIAIQHVHVVQNLEQERQKSEENAMPIF